MNNLSMYCKHSVQDLPNEYLLICPCKLNDIDFSFFSD